MLQDGLPVKFQDVKFKIPRNFRENRHEAFILLKYLIICLQSIFSAVEIIIELFVVCQKINSYLCIIFIIIIQSKINNLATIVCTSRQCQPYV